MPLLKNTAQSPKATPANIVYNKVSAEISGTNEIE